MTTEEAKQVIKEALTKGPASAIKPAILQWRKCKQAEEEAEDAIYTIAVDIFSTGQAEMKI
jgi:uncharacterized protein (UPF0335 family)